MGISDRGMAVPKLVLRPYKSETQVVKIVINIGVETVFRHL